MKPRATQTVRSIRGKWETTRFADCPDHHRRVSKFIAPTEDGWIFECSPTYGAAHRFYAQPPRSIPSTMAEAAQWFKDEVDKVSKQPTKSQT